MSNQQPDYSMFIDDYMKDAQVCFKDIRCFIKEIKANPNKVEKLELIHGGFHTIKGSSIMLGFKEIEEFARACEERLKQIRSVPITYDSLDELSKLTGQLEAMVQTKVTPVTKIRDEGELT